MKLNDLIAQLQRIEHDHPGADAAFCRVDVSLGGHSLEKTHLLDIRYEHNECVIALGRDEELAEEYKTQFVALQEQFPGRNR